MKKSRSINLYHRSLFAMNTQLDALLWGAAVQDSAQAFQTIAKRLKQLELLISRYHPDAELYQVNGKASSAPVVLSETLFNMLQRCYDYYQKTDGYFDVSLGKTYHEHKKDQQRTIHPIGACFENKVRLDPNKCTVEFLQPETELDLGGIGKGLALETVGDILRAFAIPNAFISFGGSSILTRGSHPHGDYWPFSLSEQKNDFSWQLNDDSISVSKAYVDQLQTHHIINPKTKGSVDRDVTAVIQAKDPVAAEVLSTALIAAPTVRHARLNSAFRQTTHWIL